MPFADRSESALMGADDVRTAFWRTTHVLDILEHPNQQRYGGQRIFVIQRDDYVYLVPFVEDDRLIVLKTIIPSRKATKRYLEKEADDHEA
jgi:hypothetical protein